MAGASANYRLGVRFIHGVSTSIHVLCACGPFLNNFVLQVIKGIKNGCPCEKHFVNSLMPSDAYMTNIASDNGLSPVRHQAIIWTNAVILSIRPYGTYFSEIVIQNSKVFIKGNALEHIVCEMAAICYLSQCVNWTHGNKLRWNKYIPFRKKIVWKCRLQNVC